MTLKRLQVEQEGFLAGLNLEFTPGLNVIIGARGTGKTSIIELIRFAFGVRGFTADAEERGALQAAGILESGAVSVSYENHGGEGNIVRSAAGYVVRSGEESPRCTILAQNEVESVGARSNGRLHLLDRFRESASQTQQDIDLLRAELESLTRQVSDVQAEGTSLAAQIRESAELESALAAARAEQESLLVLSRASSQEREQLASLEASSSRLASRAATVRQAVDEVQAFASSLSELRQDSWVSIWQTSEFLRDEELSSARDRVGDAYTAIESADLYLADATRSLGTLSERIQQEQSVVDEDSRRLRQRLDAVQSGVGLVSRRVQELEERLGQLRAINQRLQDRRDKFREVSNRRDDRYEQLEAHRSRKYEERVAIADSLNRTLGPQIRVRVDHAVRTEDYQRALAEALRGSGLHYNSLIPNVARAVSPMELVNWIEWGAIDDLAENLHIGRERATSLISSLRKAGLEKIISSEVDDEVILELLDGREYKPTDRLSIGQRCTVVLPILLGRHGDTLLIDQPEDHLDNAFVASTLVNALRARRPEDQFILTSHNANIPVLGEADNIIVMSSDGDRGFVSASGRLDDPEIVEHINRLMEGGRQAFSARADFYGERRRDVE